MKISIRKETPKAYNTAIRGLDRSNIDSFNESLRILSSLDVDDYLDRITKILSVNSKIADLVYQVQALYFVMQNWNKSFVDSTFIYPKVLPFPNKAEEDENAKIDVQLSSDSSASNRNNLYFTNQENLLQTANTGIKNVYNILDQQSTGKLLDQVVKVQADTEKNPSREDVEYSEKLFEIINLLQTACLYIQVQYNLCRQDPDAKFYRLMYLKSLTNPINGIPVFDPIPKRNSDDFSDLLRKATVKIEDAISLDYNYRFDFEGILHIEKFTTSKFRAAYTTTSCTGFYTVKKQTDTQTFVTGIIYGAEQKFAAMTMFGSFEGYINTNEDPYLIHITKIRSLITYQQIYTYG